LFPYTTLFRSLRGRDMWRRSPTSAGRRPTHAPPWTTARCRPAVFTFMRSKPDNFGSRSTRGAPAGAGSVAVGRPGRSRTRPPCPDRPRRWQDPCTPPVADRASSSSCERESKTVMPVQERVLAPTLRRGAHPEGLLCVANFPSNTGYAWTFIEGLFAGVADALAPHGVRSWVAYPSIPESPATLEGSAATPVALPVHLNEPRSLQALIAFIRRHRIRVLYLTDRASWHPAYPLLRLAGVRRIVIHDHTSGVRTVPRGAKRLVKQLTRGVRPMLADDVIVVSDYGARRQSAG